MMESLYYLAIMYHLSSYLTKKYLVKFIVGWLTHTISDQENWPESLCGVIRTCQLEPTNIYYMHDRYMIELVANEAYNNTKS